jgi:hypothetical protein
VARGLRSSPGRRVRPGAGSAVDETTAEDDEEADTSVSDLTTEADPSTFDQTFTDADAALRIDGEFEPVAGPKQVIPRVAYVLNHNLVYNPERGRWEPQKKGAVSGGTKPSLGTGLPFTITQGMTQPAVSFSLEAGQSAQTTQPTVSVSNV